MRPGTAAEYLGGDAPANSKQQSPRLPMEVVCEFEEDKKHEAPWDLKTRPKIYALINRVRSGQC